MTTTTDRPVSPEPAPRFYCGCGEPLNENDVAFGTCGACGAPVAAEAAPPRATTPEPRCPDCGGLASEWLGFCQGSFHRAPTGAGTDIGALPEPNRSVQEAHRILDSFGASWEPGDSVADRITILRDSYEHKLRDIGAQWRCFHCHEVFTREQDAREHFGDTEVSVAGCQIKGHEHGLLGYIRELEQDLARWREELHPLMVAMETMRAEHSAALRREEEVGYDRGVCDMRSEVATLTARAAEAERDAEQASANYDMMVKTWGDAQRSEDRLFAALSDIAEDKRKYGEEFDQHTERLQRMARAALAPARGETPTPEESSRG